MSLEQRVKSAAETFRSWSIYLIRWVGLFALIVLALSVLTFEPIRIGDITLYYPWAKGSWQQQLALLAGIYLYRG